MSPHNLSIRDGNKIDIPEEDLPVDYKPDAFRISADKD